MANYRLRNSSSRRIAVKARITAEVLRAPTHQVVQRCGSAKIHLDRSPLHRSQETLQRAPGSMDIQ
jgi:hypothetical protein